jgi:hypothetical protein
MPLAEQPVSPPAAACPNHPGSLQVVADYQRLNAMKSGLLDGNLPVTTVELVMDSEA